MRDIEPSLRVSAHSGDAGAAAEVRDAGDQHPLVAPAGGRGASSEASDVGGDVS